jgi:hypothetical protein
VFKCIPVSSGLIMSLVSCIVSYVCPMFNV